MEQGVDRALNDAVDVPVLVPVLNEERHIMQSVAATQRQRFTGRIEPLFVDGGSSDRTRDYSSHLRPWMIASASSITPGGRRRAV
jgi:hypothetical protein